MPTNDLMTAQFAQPTARTTHLSNYDHTLIISYAEDILTGNVRIAAKLQFRGLKS